MEKVILKKVAHFEKDKDGNILTFKSGKAIGKPYTRCLIELSDGRKASGFGNAVTKEWNDGDEVEILLEQKGEYLNFSLPKINVGGFTDVDRESLRAIRDNLHTYGFQLAKIIDLLEGKEVKKVDYPVYEQAPDFNPPF